MQNDSRTAYNRPDIRITNIIISSMRFRRALLDNVLEPEVFHLDPKKSDTLSFRRVTRFFCSPEVIILLQFFVFLLLLHILIISFC